MRLDDLLNDFERSLRRRDLSPHTIDAYHWALKDLIVKGMAPAGLYLITDLSREVLEDWQDSLIERDFAPRSRSLAVTASRQFLRYLADKDIIDSKVERALARVKIPEGTPHPIPKPDLALIKAHLLASPDLRSRALFFCLLTCGARIAEALRMRRDNYRNPEVVQKGGSTKRLMMPPDVHRMIAEYVDSRTDTLPALWGDLTPATSRATWRVLSATLGVAHFTTHAIRHTCATELLAAGVPEIVIAEHLGHHGLGTIRNYAKVLDIQRQQAVDVMQNLVRPTELKEAS